MQKQNRQPSQARSDLRSAAGCGLTPVSYVLTVYNKARYLPAVLRHVLAERDRTGGEIIVVDDGSTDGSREIASDQITTLDRARLYASAENRGVTATTNEAVAYSTEPWVRLVDADDLLMPGSTTELMRAAVALNAGCAFGRYGEYDPAKPCLPEQELAPAPDAKLVTDPLRRQLRRQLFNPTGALFAGNLLRNVLCPLPGNRRTSQDFALAARACVRTHLAEVDMPTHLVPAGAGERTPQALAQINRDTAELIIALDAEGGWSNSDRAAAIQRNASRAANWCRRNRPRRAGLMYALSLGAKTLPGVSGQVLVRAMKLIASVYR